MKSEHKILPLMSVVLLCWSNIEAAEIEIFPGESFENAVESLNAGDVLTVHDGTYMDSGRISIDVKGSIDLPVIIQGAPGEQRPLITRSGSADAQNTINIEGAEYLTIRGLEISSNGGDGINMSASPSYITLEDLVIHDIAVGINFRSSMHHITVRRNHIYATEDTGEGMYVGCNYATCAVSDSLIEDNWIHNTLAANQGDGIEIKRGSHSNIIRNNVIHDTNYPCILLYGTEGNPRNLVEGNVMWNCGDSGIQAAADSIIKNNIILEGPDNGFNSQPHQDVSPNNLEFVHNTIVGGSPCIRISGWGNKQGLVFANNAVYCASESFVVGSLTGAAISGNVFEPSTGSFPSTGYSTGRSEAQDFLDVANRNVYPTSDSALLGSGDPAWAVTQDFNGTARSGSVDAGAYTWTGAQNPGWMVGPGFKDSNPGPTLSFAASPSTVNFQGETTLSWSTTNAVRCTASADWSGDKPVNGNETVGPLSESMTFDLSCAGSDGSSVSDSVSVTVRQDTPSPPTMTFSAAADSVAMDGSTTLSWSSADTDSCLATNAWSGSKPTSGSESTGPLSANSTYTLECSGPGGNVSRTVTVSVEPATVPAPVPVPEPVAVAESSGGSLTWMNLFLLLVLGKRLSNYTQLRRATRSNSS